MLRWHGTLPGAAHPLGEYIKKQKRGESEAWMHHVVDKIMRELTYNHLFLELAVPFVYSPPPSPPVAG